MTNKQRKTAKNLPVRIGDGSPADKNGNEAWQNTRRKGELAKQMRAKIQNKEKS